MIELNENDYKEAAQLLNCEVAAIKAVSKVESNGSSVDSQGRIRILFEGHVFYALTKGKYGVTDISYPKWTKKYYGLPQYDRFNKAFSLDKSAAMQSCSWGLFQIMGFNYDKCGFTEVGSFVDFMKKSEKNQLLCFCRFVKSRGLDDEIRNRQWAKFAYGYNGSGYKQNAYDTKLEKWYNFYKKQG